MPDKLLDEFGVRDLESWKRHALGKLTPTSVNIYQRAIQAAFGVAKNLGYISHNPWNDVKLVAPSYDEDIPKVFKPDEILRLFEVIGQEEPWMLPMVKHYLYTGMRREEAIHLEREDYDLVSKAIHIRNKPHLKWKTKTKKDRVVPINPALLSVIEEMKKAGVFPASGLVFRSRRRPRGLLNGNWLAKTFKQCVLKTGLDGELTLHNLRHTYATTLLQQGASLYAVSQLLGHTSVKTTEKYYAWAIPTDFQREAALINFEPVAVS